MLDAPMEVTTNTREDLNRGLRLRHIQLIALGGIVGSGYFLGTGYTISKIGPGAILAYLLGGVIVWLVTMCLGELAVAIPVSGSFVNYAADYISSSWACGVGWSYWLSWVAYVSSEMVAAGIIMNSYFPGIDTLWWILLFGALITVLNVVTIDFFGETEFWLTIIKLFAIALFCFLAALIFFGIIGQEASDLGARNLLQHDGLMPTGFWSVLLTMVMVLVNFQGTEIIGLSAGEAKEPEKAIPIAVRNVTIRIIILYVLPILLLVSIFPWQRAGLEESVFTLALKSYGMPWAAGFFNFVILVAAISCSNSGIYSSVRTLFALSRKKMAPQWLAQVNKHHVPARATLVSIGCSWLFIILFYFFPDSAIYTYLLALAGFTGEVCWISICWSQIGFRKSWIASGKSKKDLKYCVPFFPVLPIFAIVIQVICLVLMVFNAEMRVALYFGIPSVLVPMAIYWLKTKLNDPVQ